MKASLFIAQAVTAGAMVTARPQASKFTSLHFDEPLDWIAGGRLFPANVIAGYNANYSAYTAESWSAHVLQQCKTFAACDNALAYSAINSGTPKIRYWFGYAFRGGPTTQQDYVRGENVQDSVAYTGVRN